MIPGFERIVEERILQAQREGMFDDLEGKGKPLCFEDLRVPEDLRIAYKILKNADCLPPEIELQKEIHRVEQLLEGLQDTAKRYKAIKKLNFLIMKLNTMRKCSADRELPQRYEAAVVERIEQGIRK